MRSPSAIAAFAAALALLALPARGAVAGHRPIVLRTPSFVVPPHSDREVCVFFRVPMKQPFYSVRQKMRNVGVGLSFTSHHLLVHQYTGTAPEAFAPYEGRVVDARQCLDLGPSDRYSRLTVATSQKPRQTSRLPRGLAFRIAPNPGTSAALFILDSHWINDSDEPRRAAVVVELHPAHPHTVRHYLLTILDGVAGAFTKVPPGATDDHTTTWTWSPGSPFDASRFGNQPLPKGPVCVVSLGSHMHKRGTLFAIDLVRADGAREELLRGESWSDPAIRAFPTPLRLAVGEGLRYACTHDNGVTRPLKLGCEEEPGVPPGRTVIETTPFSLANAAKACTVPGPDTSACPPSDPAYPGRSFTGACVPANLVRGSTSEDEMCTMTGTYYDALLDAPPGHECDLDNLPVVF
jgi:hypothetical protein